MGPFSFGAFEHCEALSLNKNVICLPWFSIFQQA